MRSLTCLLVPLVALLILVALAVVNCNPPVRVPPMPDLWTRTATPTATATEILVPSTSTSTPTRTGTPTRTAVPPTVKPPTRTPRPEDLWTTVEEPKDMLFWRDVLWVVGHKGILHVIDPKEMYVPYSRGTGGKEAWGLAVAEFGGKSKITVTHGDGTLTVIDPDQMLVVGQIHLDGRLGRPATYGRYLFVPLHDKWSVAVVDLFDPEKPGGKLVETTKTEAAPFTAAVNYTTGEVLVTHRDANKIAILDGQTGRLKGLYPIEDPIKGAKSLYSLAVDPALGTIFVSYATETDADKPNRLMIFSHNFEKILYNLETCNLGDGGQILAWGGTKVALACHGENKILSLSMEGTGIARREETVGRFPFGLAINGDGSQIFVGLKSRGANAGENMVKKVRVR